MKIITVAHQKGGVGKTTLSLNLAYCFAQGTRVAIVDSDPQASAANLKEILSQHGIDLIEPVDIPNVQDKYDVVIIDTPPYLTTSLPDFFSYSDFVLVPTKASILDIMAIRATIQLLRQAQQLKPALKTLIVLNMVKPVTTLTNDIKEALLHYDFPLANTTVSDRVSYTRSPISGGVFETDHSKAKDEIISLTQEIITALNS